VVVVCFTVAATWRFLQDATPVGELRKLPRSPGRLAVVPNPQEKSVKYCLRGRAKEKDAKIRNE
jgi:hypothetical protein